MKKYVLTAAAAALFSTSLITGAAAADPAVLTPGQVQNDYGVPATALAPGQVQKAVREFIPDAKVAKILAPGQRKPE